VLKTPPSIAVPELESIKTTIFFLFWGILPVRGLSLAAMPTSYFSYITFEMVDSSSSIGVLVWAATVDMGGCLLLPLLPTVVVLKFLMPLRD
jgi:hypothetical protein